MANEEGKRPTTPAAVEYEPRSRLTLELPKALHTRIKVACAAQQRSMRDVLLEVLEQHFPPDDAGGEPVDRSGSSSRSRRGRTGAGS